MSNTKLSGKSVLEKISLSAQVFVTDSASS